MAKFSEKWYNIIIQNNTQIPIREDNHMDILTENTPEEKTLKSIFCFLKEYSVGKHLKKQMHINVRVYQ